MALVSVKEAMALLGLDKPQAVHSIVKKADVVKRKKGGRTYFDKEELLKKIEEYRASKPTRKKRMPSPGGDTTPEDPAFQKFEGDPRLLAWNKGKWRGWCFAAIEDVDSDIMRVITHNGKKHDWMPESMLESVSKGEAFVMEPQEALRFIAAQLLLLSKKDVNAKILASRLLDLAKEFDFWKDGEDLPF